MYSSVFNSSNNKCSTRPKSPHSRTEAHSSNIHPQPLPRIPRSSYIHQNTSELFCSPDVTFSLTTNNIKNIHSVSKYYLTFLCFRPFESLCQITRWWERRRHHRGEMWNVLSHASWPRQERRKAFLRTTSVHSLVSFCLKYRQCPIILWLLFWLSSVYYSSVCV